MSSPHDNDVLFTPVHLKPRWSGEQKEIGGGCCRALSLSLLPSLLPPSLCFLTFVVLIYSLSCSFILFHFIPESLEFTSILDDLANHDLEHIQCSVFSELGNEVEISFLYLGVAFMDQILLFGREEAVRSRKLMVLRTTWDLRLFPFSLYSCYLPFLCMAPVT